SSATVASFDLYGAGLREKKRTLANSTYTAVTYDGFRRPTDIDHKTSGGTRFAGFAYAWDQNDNPLMEQRSHQSGKGDVYSYDKVNRLTKVLRDVNDPVAELATPNSETYVNKLEYDMDDVFNLTAYKVTPYGGSTTTTSYTTDAMNQYTAIGGHSPTYTDAGSLKDDGTLLYKYDAHQHLIEVRLKSTTALVAEYAYDALGLGRRITKVVGSDTTRYVHAGPQAIEEWDGTGSGANLRRLYVFGERIDQIVAMEAPDQADVDSDSNTTEVLRFSFHTQLIGSVTQVTGPSGGVVESYEYDPYGKPTIKDQGGSTVSASAIGNSYLFTARQLDEETGLYYYRARQYSPELRRFIQRDPLEYVDGPNSAGYVRCAPSRTVDPHGLRVPCAGVCTGAATVTTKVWIPFVAPTTPSGAPAPATPIYTNPLVPGVPIIDSARNRIIGDPYRPSGAIWVGDTIFNPLAISNAMALGDAQAVKTAEQNAQGACSDRFTYLSVLIRLIPACKCTNMKATFVPGGAGSTVTVVKSVVLVPLGVLVTSTVSVTVKGTCAR
ncbi:MAG: RHS repeat-associated core domain-containing protein, partial [Planctomycetes bacterium]|nr:RHS repeat-associated core domain-containing protein [Planctomycetota bacterium]